MSIQRRKSPWLKRPIGWKPFIKKLKPNVKFNPPAKLKQIVDAEKKLGLRLPADLNNLLLESNGIEDWLLPVEAIVETNLEYRTDPNYCEIYTPLNGLLFFLADGTGSYFAYPICGNAADTRPEILYWLHETDERSFAGNTLAHVIQRYLGVPMNSVKWPSLETLAHVSGRVAVPADIKNGSAAFALNQSGKPTAIEIDVPQYAFQVDYITGEHIPVILIQAEKIGDKTFFGIRYVRDNAVGICLRNELSLRGNQT